MGSKIKGAKKMNAGLKFELPDEKSEYLMAVHGADFYSTLFQVYNHCHNNLKHGDLSDTTYKILAEIQTIINECPGYNEID